MSVTGGGGEWLAMGVLSNLQWGDSFARRSWLRAAYGNWSRECSFAFVVAALRSDLSAIDHETRERIERERQTHGDVLLLEHVPERRSPFLKVIAWYRHALVAYPTATVIAKIDDDAFAYLPRLLHNLMPLRLDPFLYVGNTLWGSYSTEHFRACGRRMGGISALAAYETDGCAALSAIGPFPYTVGMMHALSRFLVDWLVEQPHLREFERRATLRARPPMLDHGEDTIIGMYMYLSPWPFTARHWGWARMHDLCFECKVKTSLWRPVTNESVVVHHVAAPQLLLDIRRNLTRHAATAALPFEVDNIDDLCSRPGVAKAYAKCRPPLSDDDE